MPDIKTFHGVSAFLINSQKGKKLFNECIAYFDYRDARFEDILKKNFYLYQNYDMPISRKTFIDDYDSLEFDDFIKKYKPKKNLNWFISKLHLAKKRLKGK